MKCRTIAQSKEGKDNLFKDSHAICKMRQHYERMGCIEREKLLCQLRPSGWEPKNQLTTEKKDKIYLLIHVGSLGWNRQRPGFSANVTGKREDRERDSTGKWPRKDKAKIWEFVIMFVYKISHPSASGWLPTCLWRTLGERICDNFISWSLYF